MSSADIMRLNRVQCHSLLSRFAIKVPIAAQSDNDIEADKTNTLPSINVADSRLSEIPEKEPATLKAIAQAFGFMSSNILPPIKPSGLLCVALAFCGDADLRIIIASQKKIGRSKHLHCNLQNGERQYKTR